MKNNSVLVAATFLLAILAHPPLAQSFEQSCTTGSFKVAVVSGGVMALWLIPFSVAIAKGPYAYEQYCPGNGGAYCCPAPTHNDVAEWDNTSTTSPATTMPGTCTFQSIPWGNCGGGNVLYCPGQTVPAPLREKTWVNPLIIASGVIWSGAATAMLISLLVGSISACNELCS